MQFFFQELYSHTDKNSGEKFEDMFLVKIANKGTFLNAWPFPGENHDLYDPYCTGKA